MPTPIPTNYVLALDPLLGFTPGGTAWLDQSVGENNFTFNNTSYTYENTIGSFYFDQAFETIANEDIKPGSLPIGTSAITIIAWIKIVDLNPTDSDFSVFSIGRHNLYQLISLGNLTSLISGVYYQRLTVYNYNGLKQGNGVSDVIPLGSWAMVSYTKPASGNVASQKLYINGVECSSYYTSNPSGVVNTSVAAGANAMVRVNNYIEYTTIRSRQSGSIGQVWIYDQVLSGADMLNFYEQTQPRYYPPAPVIDLSNGRSFQQGFSG